MNLSGRITRVEKALGAAAQGRPGRITALGRYFKTGDQADIPGGVEYPDLRAAAGRIPRTAEAGQKGLGAIRLALGADLPAGASVLERIAAGPVMIVRKYIIRDGEKPPEDPQADLLGRLGFDIIRLEIVRTRPEPEGIRCE